MPNFAKELAKPTQEKLFLKNFPSLQKNKKQQADKTTPAPNISLAKTAGNVFDLKFFANFETCASVEDLC